MKYLPLLSALLLLITQQTVQATSNQIDPCAQMIQLPAYITQDLNRAVYGTENPDQNLIQQTSEMLQQEQERTNTAPHQDDSKLIHKQYDAPTIFNPDIESQIFSTSPENFFKLKLQLNQEAEANSLKNKALQNNANNQATEGTTDDTKINPNDNTDANLVETENNNNNADEEGQNEEKEEDESFFSQILSTIQRVTTGSSAKKSSTTKKSATTKTAATKKAAPAPAPVIKLPDPDIITVKDVMDNFHEAVNEINKVIAANSQKLSTSFAKDSQSLHSTINSTITQIHNIFQANVKSILKAVDTINMKTRAEIKKRAKEIIELLDFTQKRIDQTIEQEIRAQIDFLREKLEERDSIIKNLESQIEKFQSELPPTDSFCNMYQDCGTCTANPKCGWCETQEFCMPGDKIGPSNDICKQWNYGICRGECGKYTKCIDCVGDLLCGWCAQNFQCLQAASDYQGCGTTTFYHQLTKNTVCPVPNKQHIADMQQLQALKAQKEADVAATLVQQSEEDKEIYSKQKELIQLERKRNHYKEEVNDFRKLYAELTAKIARFEHCIETKLGPKWKTYLNGDTKKI